MTDNYDLTDIDVSASSSDMALGAEYMENADDLAIALGKNLKKDL